MGAHEIEDSAGGLISGEEIRWLADSGLGGFR